MHGLMMDYQLTLPAIVRRAAALFGHKRVVSRLGDRSLDRRSYAEILERATRLSVALSDLGVRPGDRVATLAWSGHQHLEAYLAIPLMGAVLHTLNLRLHPDDLIHIVNDAADRVVMVDECLLPLFEKIRPHVSVEHVIVTSASGAHQDQPGGLDYEALLAAADPSRFVEPVIVEQDACAMCYTSGTTGRPKGVLYSHRAMVLHSMAQGFRGCMGLTDDETVLPVVPMFHVNAWGLPYGCLMFGSDQILPGPHLDARSIAELLAGERVTITAGVPTVWLALLNELDQHPRRYDLSRLRSVVVGGAAVPPSLIRGFQERHNLTVIHAWGMTEMTPVGSFCRMPASLEQAPLDEQYAYRARQGRPLPLVEIRARGDDGLIPWDGATMGELEVRGPWVAERYYHADDSDPRFCDDGWFKTGDIVRIDPSGCIELADRSKDLVKSGGEWISSVALEGALMGHPAVAEAAVIAVPHARWGERPLAVVVLKPGQHASFRELVAFVAPQFPKWWLPDAVEFVAEIPRTSAGKFLKSALRQRYCDAYSHSVQDAAADAVPATGNDQ